MSKALGNGVLKRDRDRRPSSRRRLIRTGATVASWVAVAAVLFLALPDRFGGQTNYTVVAGQSMEPTYSTGDLLIGRQRDRYSVGDVVVYEVPKGEPGQGSGVVHRIVGGDNVDGWVLQGDNNDHVDFWRPGNHDIRSSVLLRIPKAGYLLHYGSHPMLFALLGAVVVGRLLWPADEDAKKAAIDGGLIARGGIRHLAA